MTDPIFAPTPLPRSGAFSESVACIHDGGCATLPLAHCQSAFHWPPFNLSGTGSPRLSILPGTTALIASFLTSLLCRMNNLFEHHILRHIQGSVLLQGLSRAASRKNRGSWRRRSSMPEARQESCIVPIQPASRGNMGSQRKHRRMGRYAGM